MGLRGSFFSYKDLKKNGCSLREVLHMRLKRFMLQRVGQRFPLIPESFSTWSQCNIYIHEIHILLYSDV
jgi:hypothetical protein